MAEKLTAPGEPTNAAQEGPPARPAPRSAPTQARAQARPPAQEEGSGDRPGPAVVDDDRPASPSGWWMVQEDIEVPKSGGKFLLHKGKVITEKSYDIQGLIDAGAKLKPASEPGWARRLREDGSHQAR